MPCVVVTILATLNYNNTFNNNTSSSSNSFYDETLTVEVTANLSQLSVGITLAPLLDNATEMRFVLNWGPDPPDLDTHILQINRTTGESCLTWWQERGGCPGLAMDVDTVGGGDNGAETVTWTSLDDFVYLIFIRDYEFQVGDKAIVESGARMALYGRDNSSEPLVIRGEVNITDPNTRSRYWLIGCVDGEVGLPSFTYHNLLMENEPTKEACVGSSSGTGQTTGGNDYNYNNYN